MKKLSEPYKLLFVRTFLANYLLQLQYELRGGRHSLHPRRMSTRVLTKI